MADLGVFDCSQDDLPDGCCWACGRPSQMQRCHIVSHQHGGADTVDNLVILCRGCHDESEDLHAAAFLPWIRAKRRDEWKDEYTHVALKLGRIGYPRPAIEALVTMIGTSATADIIARAWCADPDTAARLAGRIKAIAAI